jgi:dUTP pyrophosphatase
MDIQAPLSSPIPATFEPEHIDPEKMPEYQTEGSVGVDLPADIQNSQTISPGGRSLVPTGLKVALPPSLEAQVRPRSGLALNYGITVLNTPGTIDQDYRGDIGVILINHSAEPYTIAPGQRIAQLVFTPVVLAHFKTTDDLPDVEETHQGFGSTGQ